MSVVTGCRRHAGPDEGDGVREIRNGEDKRQTEQRKRARIAHSPVTSFVKSKVKVRTRAEPKRPADMQTPRKPLTQTAPVGTKRGQMVHVLVDMRNAARIRPPIGRTSDL